MIIQYKSSITWRRSPRLFIPACFTHPSLRTFLSVNVSINRSSVLQKNTSGLPFSSGKKRKVLQQNADKCFQRRSSQLQS
jgi:hypothetical protein